MEKKTVINKIKALFSSEEVMEDVVATEEVVAEDPNYDHIDLPLGVHEINGKIYTVTEVESEEESTEEAVEEVTEEVVEESFEAAEPIAEVVAEEVVEVETEEATEEVVEEVEANATKNDLLEVHEMFASMKAEIEVLSKSLSAFAAEPAEQPTETKVSFGKNTREAKLKFFSK